VAAGLFLVALAAALRIKNEIHNMEESGIAYKDLIPLIVSMIVALTLMCCIKKAGCAYKYYPTIMVVSAAISSSTYIKHLQPTQFRSSELICTIMSGMTFFQSCLHLRLPTCMFNSFLFWSLYLTCSYCNYGYITQDIFIDVFMISMLQWKTYKRYEETAEKQKQLIVEKMDFSHQVWNETINSIPIGVCIIEKASKVGQQQVTLIN